VIRYAVGFLALVWCGCLVGYITGRYRHPAWSGFVSGGIGVVLGVWIASALGLLP
jgi:hypothetical protein